MPKMNFNRKSPRSFITHDNYLYVVGGESQTTERIDLKK